MLLLPRLVDYIYLFGGNVLVGVPSEGECEFDNLDGELRCGI